MRRAAAWVGIIVLWAAPASAQVVLDQWGSFASITSSDCADFCDPESDLSWLLGLTFGPTNGGAQVDSIDASLSNSRGDAFGEADVQTLLNPVVRVDANAAAGGWMDGTGTAVQGYTYVGPVATTIDVDVHLTGTIGNPDADPSTGLAAQVSYVGPDVSTLVFANAVAGLIIPDGAVQLEQSADGAVDLSDTLSIPVTPGSQFYLVASSSATAGGLGAFADSLGTLSIQFDPADAPNLQGGPVGPALVPSLSWPFLGLLALALAGLGARARGPSTQA